MENRKLHFVKLVLLSALYRDVEAERGYACADWWW